MRSVTRWLIRVARRAGPVALIWAAFASLGVASANAQCGQTTQVSPRQSLGSGAAPLAVGDSVLYDAADALSYYGFETNAMVCRTMAQGVVWLQDHAGNLPVLVVVALGTNGAVTTGQINELLAILGPSRLLALVTPHDGNYAYVPGLIRLAASQHPGQIILLDWDRLSAGHPDWFAPDGIHLGSAAGIDAFARLVASSLQASPAAAPASAAAPIGPQHIGAPHTIQPANPLPSAPPKPPPETHADRLAQVIVSAVDGLRRWLSGV
jgi:hypothetical protein